MTTTPITVTTNGITKTAGSYAEFELDPVGAPGVFSPLCFDSLPEVMIEAELLDVTQVCNETKQYIDGVSDTPEITLTTNADLGNADLQTLKALAIARETVRTRFVYKNGETAEFDLQFLAYGKGETSGGEALKEGFKGKVSGDITHGTV